jgi:predicted Fe-Mo cluster-binding NifX family protein
MAKKLGMVLKINTVLLKGINDSHVMELTRKLSGMGADIGNIMQLIPVEGSRFYTLPKVSMDECREIRWKCGAYLPQMTHCRQCRADAVGLLGEDRSIEFRSLCNESACGKLIEKKTSGFSAGRELFKIAVVSKSGVLVDSHFGQAERFYIYESDGESSKLVENRKVGDGFGCGGSCMGGKKEKPKGFIMNLVEALRDCHGVIAMRIGESPMALLEERGISSFVTYETVEKAVMDAALALSAKKSSSLLHREAGASASF